MQTIIISGFKLIIIKVQAGPFQMQKVSPRFLTLTGEAVVFYGAADDGGGVDEEDPSVLDGVGLPAVDLDAGGRPRRPRPGRQALDVVVALKAHFSYRYARKRNG